MNILSVYLVIVAIIVLGSSISSLAPKNSNQEFELVILTEDKEPVVLATYNQLALCERAAKRLTKDEAFCELSKEE